jgi:sugar phosphate isomerase/epimerase
MTGGESLDSMVKAMEEAGYKYIELPDIGIEDYKIIQRALADTR